jgi:hypothetical protein
LLGFAGKLDKVPDFKTESLARSGERTQGWRYSKRWGRELTLALVAEIERWVNGLKPRYSYWQGIVRMLHFHPDAESEFKRSGPNVVLQLGSEINDYLVDATMTTVRVRSRQLLGAELRGMLEEAIEQGFYAYIIGTTVFNYRLRTEQERLIWLRNKKFRHQQRMKEAKRAGRNKPKPKPKFLSKPKPKLLPKP